MKNEKLEPLSYDGLLIKYMNLQNQMELIKDQHMNTL